LLRPVDLLEALRGILVEADGQIPVGGDDELHRRIIRPGLGPRNERVPHLHVGILGVPVEQPLAAIDRLSRLLVTHHHHELGLLEGVRVLRLGGDAQRVVLRERADAVGRLRALPAAGRGGGDERDGGEARHVA
jgi:hypothetical protein